MMRSVDRWLSQTKAGGGHVALEERGDCVPACVASILNLPITAVANCHGEGWWDDLQEQCARWGYMLVIVDLRQAPPDGYWIASLPSLNLPVEPDGKQALHCVVARGCDLAHDPCLGRRYTSESWLEQLRDGRVVEGWVLVPRDPALWVMVPDGR